MRRVAVLIAAAALALAGAALAVPGGKATPGPAPAVEERALLAYEKELTPLVQDGGRVVQQGMKPAVNDMLHEHTLPDEELTRRGESWVLELQDVRGRIAAVVAPPALEPAHAAFLAALTQYLDAAETLRAAAGRPAGAERERLLSRGIEQAEQADDTYDRGSAVLQRARHELGLASSPYFPEVSRA